MTRSLSAEIAHLFSDGRERTKSDVARHFGVSEDDLSPIIHRMVVIGLLRSEIIKTRYTAYSRAA